MNFRMFGFVTFAIMPMFLCMSAQAAEPSFDINVDISGLEYLPTSLAVDPSSFTTENEFILLVTAGQIDQCEFGGIKEFSDLLCCEGDDEPEGPEPPSMATVVFLSCASIIFVKK